MLFLFLLQLILYFYNFSDQDHINEQEFAWIEAKIDSLKKSQPDISIQKIFTFNPNYISDFKAYSLGLTVDQTDRLFTFRQQGNFVNSAEDFQEITGVSDSLLKLISPLFRFPSWINKKKKRVTPTVSKKIPTQIKDLNQVSLEELLLIEGVSSKLAQRIIAYKKLLTAFSLNEQLYEVFYLEQETADRILQHYQVIDTPYIDKLNINTATFKEILKVPYINYELTKKLIRYREENILFQNLEELKKIDSFPLEKYRRIALYLSAE